MKINFEEIKIKNFMSFQEAELCFNQNSYVVVRGINNNPKDTAQSNGSGKSSLWESIVWCLTGETIRGTKDVSRYGAEIGAEVVLDFTVDNDHYEITRTKDPSNLIIIENGINKSGKGIRDTEKILNQILPDITSQLLGSVVVLGQGLPLRFTNNTPSGRKELLESLSKSDFMIEDLKERVSNRSIELQKKLQDFSVDKLVGKKEILEKTVLNYKEQLNNLEDEEVLSAKLTNLNSEIQSNELLLKDREECLTKISQEASSLQNALNLLLVEKATEENKVKESFNDKLLKFEKDKSTINTEVNTLKKELVKLKSIVDVCPTCGQKLINVHKPDTSPIEAELEEKRQLLVSLCETGDKINNELSDALFNVKHKFEIDSAELTSEINKYNIDIKKINLEINTYKSNISQLSSHLQKCTDTFNQLTFKRDTYLKGIEDSENEIKNIDEKILYNNKEAEAVQEHLSVIKKMSTLLSRDFRGHLLKNIISYINQKAKEYSNEVFDEGIVEFTLDGNNISISFDKREYENLSSGEKQKIDIIVQFALRDMLCKFSDFSCNVLVLDEIFDGLDKTGCNRVIDLISNKLSDVDNVYIVTHRSDLDIPIDKEIIVTKNAFGVSSI